MEVPCGRGKCLAKNTEIVMFDGTIKYVQDIVVGDLLMGDDSTPRKVLSLARGREMMYKISTIFPNAQPLPDFYIVNKIIYSRCDTHKQMKLWIFRYLIISGISNDMAAVAVKTSTAQKPHIKGIAFHSYFRTTNRK